MAAHDSTVQYSTVQYSTVQYMLRTEQEFFGNGNNFKEYGNLLYE